jgi:hypothetical protein
MFYDLRWEVVVRFVDIAGIVDHECLNLLFICFFLSIFRITKLHNLLKQQQEIMRQMADHLHVDIKLDNLSLAESLRSEMASRIGLWFILK